MGFHTIQILAVAIGGATGAVLRFGISRGVHSVFGLSFPLGTLVVNVVGSFLIGFLSVYFLEKFASMPALRLGMTVGLLGALTTFSTFSLETLTLLDQGQLIKAAANVALNVVLCLLLAWLGMVFARQL